MVGQRPNVALQILCPVSWCGVIHDSTIIILFYCCTSNLCISHVSDKDLVRAESEGGVPPWPSQFPSSPGVSPETLKAVEHVEATEMQLCYPSS